MAEESLCRCEVRLRLVEQQGGRVILPEIFRAMGGVVEVEIDIWHTASRTYLLARIKLI